MHRAEIEKMGCYHPIAAVVMHGRFGQFAHFQEAGKPRLCKGYKLRIAAIGGDHV